MYDYQYDEGFALVLNDDFPFNINTHLILPFCIVVGLCFIIMLGFMVARCVRERRRILRYRLPRSSLRKLETRKFNKNENYETCAICLDDYEEGDKLRILPCNHGEKGEIFDSVPHCLFCLSLFHGMNFSIETNSFYIFYQNQ